MSDLSAEFAEGRRAYQDGQPDSANPYEHGSTWGRLWRDGWEEARFDDAIDCFGED